MSSADLKVPPPLAGCSGELRRGSPKPCEGGCATPVSARAPKFQPADSASSPAPIQNVYRGEKERLRPCRAEDKQIRGEASATARAGGGAPAPVEKVFMKNPPMTIRKKSNIPLCILEPGSSSTISTHNAPRCVPHSTPFHQTHAIGRPR